MKIAGMRETPAEIIDPLRSFLLALLFTGILFWFGSVLISNRESPSVPLRLPHWSVVLFALQVLVLISRESTLGNPRYLLGNFPYFLALGMLLKNNQAFSFVLALFAALLGLFAALVASGYRVAAF